MTVDFYGTWLNRSYKTHIHYEARIILFSLSDQVTQTPPRANIKQSVVCKTLAVMKKSNGMYSTSERE